LIDSRHGAPRAGWLRGRDPAREGNPPRCGRPGQVSDVAPVETTPAELGGEAVFAKRAVPLKFDQSSSGPRPLAAARYRRQRRNPKVRARPNSRPVDRTAGDLSIEAESARHGPCRQSIPGPASHFTAGDQNRLFSGRSGATSPSSFGSTWPSYLGAGWRTSSSSRPPLDNYLRGAQRPRAQTARTRHSERSPRKCHHRELCPTASAHCSRQFDPARSSREIDRRTARNGGRFRDKASQRTAARNTRPEVKPSLGRRVAAHLPFAKLVTGCGAATV
jgi:hypothetical protein